MKLNVQMQEILLGGMFISFLKEENNITTS